MRADHLERVVRELFQAPDPSLDPRVGVEVEFLCRDLESGGPAPPMVEPGDGHVRRRGTVAVVTDLARKRGWARSDGAGLPVFTRPDGTVVSWEPGGQIEVATPPLGSLDALHTAVLDAVSDLAEGLEGAGLGLLARGMDPTTPVEASRLWLDHPRYRRMAAHYDRAGPDGRRMMRQSAAIHVNLDLGAAPVARWDRANAVAPAATAVFANSPRVEGRPGWRSERARAWRTLDPSRTGVFAPGPDPVARYLDFARHAEAFLVGPRDQRAVRWADIEEAADEGQWRAHLTTLFPEVRPRGYLELRSVDTVPTEHVVVVAAFLAGVVYGDTDISSLPEPSEERLRRAGRMGVTDREIRAEALGWWEVAVDGLEALGPRFASPALLDRLASFRQEFTRRGRDVGAAEDAWVRARVAGDAQDADAGRRGRVRAP